MNTKNKVIKMTAYQEMIQKDIIEIKNMNIQQNDHILSILQEIKGIKTIQTIHQKAIFALLGGLGTVLVFVIKNALVK